MAQFDKDGSEKVLYMAYFTQAQMKFFNDPEWWKDGTFDERLNMALNKGIMLIKAERS
ncbi:hypothetical protein LCGC14_0771520 [marine sediment metagenome]|uniref:Uncharacterized protein n=1 Tax=marine sediment metagenome TaxID=412755 RepID=A0A0F9Q299_9ZZZZ